jgi:ATP-dependent Lon protease
MVHTRSCRKTQQKFSDSDSDSSSSILSVCSNNITDHESESDGEPVILQQRVKKRRRSKRRTGVTTSKKKKHKLKCLPKDDSSASGIDIENCSSTKDEYDEDYNDEYQILIKKYIDITENTRVQKANIRNIQWQHGLTKNEIKKHEHEYIKICKVIGVVPTIYDLLKVNMPFKTKCELMDSIIILGNVHPETVEYLGLKTSILDKINKYKKFPYVEKTYIKYNLMEKKLEKNECNEIPLKYKILGSDMNFSNKTIIYNKYKHWSNLSEHSSERPKLLNWINTALSLPNDFTSLPVGIMDDNVIISKYLYDVKYKLNLSIYGMENVKEQILCIINNKITNPKLVGSALALHGVQGVGKTKIIQALADAINIPFTSIPLGGATDSSFLIGYNFCYEGSVTGSIISSIIKMKTLNGIIFFDEIDKISKTRHGDEISKSLLHITDFTQNHSFTDRYLGNDIKINLSNMWFIYSLNYAEIIDKTLIDRIPIINVDGYNKQQKYEMANKYLLPDALKNINIKKDDIIFSNNALLYLIDETNKMYSTSTKDKNGNTGVRKLKDAIHNIVTKLNFLKNCILPDGTYGELNISFKIDKFKLPFVVERHHIDTLQLTKVESDDPPIHMYT